jgi:hypothetical protein
MSHENISDFLIERYLIGEVSEDEIALVEKAVSEDSSLKEHIESLKADSADFFEARPPALYTELIEKKALAMDNNDRKKNSFSFVPFLNFRNLVSFAVALSIVCAVVIFSPRSGSRVTPSSGVFTEDGTRIKGSEELYLYVKNESGISQLFDRAEAAEGDLIQIGYRNGTFSQGMIFSVDGSGVTTVHFPRGGTVSDQIMSQKRIILDSSYRLDDAPLYENFYFVYSNTPFTLEQVKPIVDGVKKVEGLHFKKVTLQKK